MLMRNTSVVSAVCIDQTSDIFYLRSCYYGSCATKHFISYLLGFRIVTSILSGMTYKVLFLCLQPAVSLCLREIAESTGRENSNLYAQSLGVLH